MRLHVAHKRFFHPAENNDAQYKNSNPPAGKNDFDTMHPFSPEKPLWIRQEHTAHKEQFSFSTYMCQKMLLLQQ